MAGISGTASGRAPMGQVLVLNASYEPLNITSWRRATVMLLKDKADGLEHAGDRSPLALANREIGALPPAAKAEAGKSGK